MSNTRKFLILGAFLFLSGTALLFRSDVKETALPQTSSSPQVSSESEEQFLVTRVIDGDTVVLANGEKVRYIGIDAPETYKKNQCFGEESKNKNKELVEGKSVRLEKDISERDKYGRLLRFIWIGDTFVNDYLVRQGYAKAYRYPPDVKYSSQFVEAEKEARENNRGLWSKCAGTSILYSNEVSPSPVSITPITNVNCSSNSYNCTDFKTQAEAQNVFNYCMKTVGYDVHKLDRNRDGRACETLP